MSVIIREKESETVLAEAEEMGRDVIGYEGNLYFDPAAVVGGVLQVTEKTYTCPVQGDLPLGRLPRPRRPNRRERRLGLRPTQARPRGHQGPLRVLRRNPRADPPGGLTNSPR